MHENEQIVQDNGMDADMGRHGIWHADASSGHKCKFSHCAHFLEVPQDPQGGRPDEETEDSDEDQLTLARREWMQEDNDEDPGSSGASSSWE